MFGFVVVVMFVCLGGVGVRVSYILALDPFSDIWIANIFSLFTLLIVSFINSVLKQEANGQSWEVTGPGHITLGNCRTKT